MKNGRDKLIELINGLEHNFEKDIPKEIKNYSYEFEVVNGQTDMFNYVLGYGENVLLKNNVIMKNRIIKRIDNLKYEVIYEFVKWMRVITDSDGTKKLVYSNQIEDVPTENKEVA